MCPTEEILKKKQHRRLLDLCQLEYRWAIPGLYLSNETGGNPGMFPPSVVTLPTQCAPSAVLYFKQIKCCLPLFSSPLSSVSLLGCMVCLVSMNECFYLHLWLTWRALRVISRWLNNNKAFSTQILSENINRSTLTVLQYAPPVQQRITACSSQGPGHEEMPSDYWVTGKALCQALDTGSHGWFQRAIKPCLPEALLRQDSQLLIILPAEAWDRIQAPN